MKRQSYYEIIPRVITTAIILFLATAVAQARTIYTNHDDKFMWNSLCVINNQWGRENNLDPNWYQRVILEDDNTISIEYRWDSRNYNIMGYPGIIAGWHWGYQTPIGAFGLPSRVSDNISYLVSADVSHTDEGTYPEFVNVAWDIWLAPSDNPSVPNYEIMVWPWYVRQLPDGTLQDRITLWGAEWDVYRYLAGTGGGPAWNSFSFLRTTPTLQPAGNLGEFISYLHSRGWLPDDERVVGIEFGTELGRGQGSFRINSYSLAVPEPVCPNQPSGDFNDNCIVDINDLDIFNAYWLTDEPSTDIAPAIGPDGIVNTQDFSVFAQDWQ